MEEELLELTKDFLGLAWIYESAEKKLKIIISNSVADLDEKSGVNNIYTEPGKAQRLFLNRVMYERANALDDFYVNYRKEIIAFINKAKVRKYAGKQE